MKKRIIASIALGGAALLAIPAGVAYAVADGHDNTPSLSRAFGSFGSNTNGNRRDTGDADSGMARGSTAGGMNGQVRGGMRGGTQDGSNQGFGNSTRGGGYGSSAAGDVSALVEPGSTISAGEEASLTYMVEEEKLAHDLYVEFGDAWDLRIFDNISGAETQHGDAVRALLDAYGVADPTAGLAAGEFVNPELQSLYDTLLAQGLTSSTAALEVGGIVEETDILDLRNNTSDNAAIDQVFGQLESGSENHLRAFAMNLDRLGVDYVAQVLSSSDVAGITGQ